MEYYLVVWNFIRIDDKKVQKSSNKTEMYYAIFNTENTVDIFSKKVSYIWY